MGLSVDRPVAFLSENDIEYLTLALGAMWAGVPVAPVSSAYSLILQDYGKLRQILGIVTPGLVFAANAGFAKAIATVLPAEVPVVLTEGAAAAIDGPLAGRDLRHFNSRLAIEPGATLIAAHAAVGPDTVAKCLYTSGTTKALKGVVNTHRMLCANQQRLRQCMVFLADEPPVLLDWLPWTHAFGGNHNLGLTLYNGGTLYIDDGKPTPKGIAATLRNLREISPTACFNVPKEFEEIAFAMDTYTVLYGSAVQALQGLHVCRRRPESLRVFRSGPLITPKDARSSLQMLAIARAMAALCAQTGRLSSALLGHAQKTLRL